MRWDLRPHLVQYLTPSRSDLQIGQYFVFKRVCLEIVDLGLGAVGGAGLPRMSLTEIFLIDPLRDRENLESADSFSSGGFSALCTSGGWLMAAFLGTAP